MTSNPSAEPAEPPPTYEAATAPQSSNSLRVRNGIPPAYRRSMEDEGRPLPSGWVRQYDPENHHQFFVDTTREPPRSIWHHPYDDDEYLATLDPTERQKIQSSLRVPSNAELAAESSEDDQEHHRPTTQSLPPRPTPSNLARKMKDKLTGTTHEERQEQRRQRAIAEEQLYERHRQLRQAMVTAIRTGEPQHVGTDRDGRDIYIEPPQADYPSHRRSGYNPYITGPYANPNARFLRPAQPYGRPYGRGYGGGYGLPLAGGLMGGMLLGGMMGGMAGGFGGGDCGGF
ncbi:MAG: hypothetical protein LQ337_007512 [Flavoplaca oasis]|nr:MAG: hypothetical protein LQ337_007512 [Flavoplaca oasis]